MGNRKIILHSIGNYEDFNYYIFDKKKETHVILNKLFKDIFNCPWNLRDELIDRKGNSSLINIDITKKKDIHEKIVNRLNKNIRIDFYYGYKRIFVSIHCDKNLRTKFNVELAKISTMPKLKLHKKKYTYTK